MRISLLAVGSKMPDWVQAGFDEYRRRLPPELQLDLKAIPLAKRGKNPDIRRLVAREGEQMLAAIPRGDRVIALEVGGKRWTTEQLASRLSNWQMDGENLTLLVGGPDGLAPVCRERADQQWSLSDLTLPHPLVRIVLAEQLYRAWAINSGHPYHR